MGSQCRGGADVKFYPGIYYIEGELKSSGGLSISGTGVGFYLTGDDAGVDVSGGGTVNLSAPETGPMAGLIFAQDANSNPGHKNHLLSGTGDLYYEGTIYFPTQSVDLSGGSTATTPSPFTVWIAQNFNLSGGSQIVINSDFASSSVPVPSGAASGSNLVD